jgi:hypothetical protein
VYFLLVIYNDRILKRIRYCIQSEKWEVTLHADEEAQDDNVSISDIKHAIENGKIIKKSTNDPRGTRYKLLGETFDGRLLNIVLKFNSLNEVKLITVFIEVF